MYFLTFGIKALLNLYLDMSFASFTFGFKFSLGFNALKLFCLCFNVFL